MTRSRSLLLALVLPFVCAAARADSCDLAGSVVPNCSFDVDTQGWVLIATGANWVGDDCATAPGCVLVAGGSGAIPVSAWSSCFPVAPLAVHSFGVSIKLASGNADLGCFLTFSPFQDPACAYQLELETRVHFYATVGWTEQLATVTTGADTNYAQLIVDCASWSEPFTIRIDDALVVPPIFADGFGSGDTSRWSVSVP